MRLPVLFAALLAAGTALASGATLAGERSVTDDAGRTVLVPEHPRRIVVMHEPLLGLPLMDLGLPVVGSYGRGDDGRFVTAVDFIDAVVGDVGEKPRGIGAIGEIDLERLKALQPDLILGTERDVDKVPRLSTVAPVYLQNVSTGKTRGFAVEEELAALVGEEDRFARRHATYAARVEAVRGALPRDPAGRTYVALFLTDQINLVGEMSGAVQALEDLGYRRLPLARDGGASIVGSTLLVPISAELFGRLDPDLLVLMNTYTGGQRDEAGVRAALDRIVPGWDRFLKPVREGRVLFLDSVKVTTPTVASALHTLDAVEAWSAR